MLENWIIWIVYYDDLIIEFSRREEINDVVVKSIGKGPYYVVGMDNWADLFDKKGITNILNKAVITRLPHWVKNVNGTSEEKTYGFVDTTKINDYYHTSWDNDIAWKNMKLKMPLKQIRS